MNIFHYLFYFINSYMIKFRNRKDSVFYSSLFLSIIEVFLLYDIFYIIERITGLYYEMNKLEIMILYWVFASLNSLYFYRKDRFKKINSKYHTQEKRLKRIRNILIISVILIIYILFLTLASIRID